MAFVSFKSGFNTAIRQEKFTTKCAGNFAKLAQHPANKRASSPTAAVTIHRNACNRRHHVRMGGVDIQGFGGSSGRRQCVGAFAPHMISEARLRVVNLALRDLEHN
ncbi:uncharacterized protein TM35_000931060 [Trypanosoma theileri]|uniref:Uncharacterized protein n=1 Tax=Trypanosoma theileri TaxID=67003 RepID=A0A1X0NEJ6_9TRYP|nr:uncharacterized protein TM35_000931060 [Trypanosoma theileri]ORC82348.1 hypothetical protein TM35_000931060 [Trypanosoma theileri]